MTKPAVRPKRWRDRPQSQVAAPEPAKKDDELPTHAAPGHLGAQVTHAGYTSGRGGFGFRQDIEESWGGRAR